MQGYLLSIFESSKTVSPFSGPRLFYGTGVNGTSPKPLAMAR